MYIQDLINPEKKQGDSKMAQIRIFKGIMSLPLTIKNLDGTVEKKEGGFRENIHGSIWVAMYGEYMITASVELNGQFQSKIEDFITEQLIKLNETKVGNLEI